MQLPWPTLQNQDFTWNDSTMHHIQLHSELGLKPHAKKKASNNHKLATNIIVTRQPSVKNEIKKRSIILVQNCVKKDTCLNFKVYFKIISHDQETQQNNGYSLQISNTKLKYAKCGFFLWVQHYTMLYPLK